MYCYYDIVYQKYKNKNDDDDGDTPAYKLNWSLLFHIHIYFIFSSIDIYTSIHTSIMNVNEKHYFNIHNGDKYLYAWDSIQLSV